MGLREIRKNFNVNARRGSVIKFTASDGTVHTCKILSAKNGRIHAVSVTDCVIAAISPCNRKRFTHSIASIYPMCSGGLARARMWCQTCSCTGGGT